MAFSQSGTVDNTTLANQAILKVVDPIRGVLQVKFPKVKPTGGTVDANDAAWQTRMATEVINAHNASLNGGASNASPLLAHIA